LFGVQTPNELNGKQAIVLLHRPQPTTQFKDHNSITISYRFN
jgi:hypothetical protein